MATSPIPKTKKARRKMGVVLGEFKRHSLHSGRSGKIVTDPGQALAIAASEARRASWRHR